MLIAESAESDPFVSLVMEPPTLSMQFALRFLYALLAFPASWRLRRKNMSPPIPIAAQGVPLVY
jgi:hypothetical protein